MEITASEISCIDTGALKGIIQYIVLAQGKLKHMCNSRNEAVEFSNKNNFKDYSIRKIFLGGTKKVDL